MNRLIKNTKQTGLLIIAICLSITVSGQTTRSIQGKIVNGLNQKPVPFASVVLLNPEDSSQVKGTISEIDGKFSFHTINKGNYLMEVSHVGYKSYRQSFQFNEDSIYDAGTIRLKEKSTGIKKVMVFGKRIKAKDEGNKTTYFIDKKMHKATNTGVDIVKLIPGVQLDMMQNLSLEGGQNVVILVNGRERDLNFIRQLDAGSIDKIEINTSPGAEYASDVNGVINVILKEKNKGISGHINAEIPTSHSEMYLFPNYSLQYGIKNFIFYTSYTGELSYFDIIDHNTRSFSEESEENEENTIQKIQHLRQKNWSHRFNLGMDYNINKKNQINIYGYYNPFYQEHDGRTMLKTNGNAIDDTYWSAKKDDTNKSRIAFFSAYFSHQFAQKNKLNVDLSYYSLRAENKTQYATDSVSGIENKDIVNKIKPGVNTALIKMDYTAPIIENWQIKTGLKNTLKLYSITDSELFNQHENIFAFYGKTNYTGSSIRLNAGLRYEQAIAKVRNEGNQKNSALLPSVEFSYKISKNQNLSLSYNSEIHRPNIYQLDPSVVYNDPYLRENGNPDLKQEHRYKVFLGYSFRTGSNFLSSGLFYQKNTQMINKLTVLNSNNMFETAFDNLGTMYRYGVQLNGSWSFGRSFSVQPYIKIFNLTSLPNNFAREHGIAEKREVAIESGLSATLTLNNGFTTTMRYQYNTPRSYMQSSFYSDALYFLSVEKNILKNLKLGITSGIPFNRAFTYYGKEIENNDFSSQWEGTIQTSGFPLWVKLSYRFNSGKRISKIRRNTEKVEQIPKKGF
jgi:outer membrane receptor protein involved in Fe transport